MSLRAGIGSPISGALVASRHAGLGMRAGDVPSTGTHGPAYPYKSLNLPADAEKEIRAVIETLPAAGTLEVFPDTSFIFRDAPDGSDSFVWRLYEDGADKGTATAGLEIGTTARIPTLSLPGVIDVTQTSARPKVTLAY